MCIKHFKLSNLDLDRERQTIALTLRGVIDGDYLLDGISFMDLVIKGAPNKVMISHPQNFPSISRFPFLLGPFSQP